MKEKPDYSYPITDKEKISPHSDIEEGWGTLNPKPHPDGQPWTKCCGLKSPKVDQFQDGSGFCAYRRNYTNRNSRLGIKHYNLGKHFTAGRFFCVHRKDGEYFRVCAGWHCCQNGGKK